MTDRPALAAALHALADRVFDLDPARIVGELEAMKFTVWTANVAVAPTNGATEDRLLKIEEAAERLKVTDDWLRRRPDLPFVVKLSEGVVRYSSRGIDAYIVSLASHT